MSKHARFTPTGMAAVATATALLCLALSVTTPARAQGGGSNPPWYPSLMASEAYDSGRTRLFEQANFTGSFNQPNVVDVLTSPENVYLTPYNVVYRNADSMFVYGGGYGDQGGMGAFVAKVDSNTLEKIWFKQLINIDTTKSDSEWDYPGVVGMLKDGMLYVIYGYQLTKLDRDGNEIRTTQLPSPFPSPWPLGDTSYNGFVALPDGTIIAKSVYRAHGCSEQGFDAFLDCEDAKLVPPSILVAIDPETLAVKDMIEVQEFSVGRVTASRFKGKDYIYVPGDKHVYRFIYENGGFRPDDQWKPVQYIEDGSGQTPASALVVMNDWVMFTTNGKKIDQPCVLEGTNKPCQSGWLTVWAINQADSSIYHNIQPFKDMVAPSPQPGQTWSYPFSFAPSAPTVDPLRNRIFVFDAGPGKIAALDLGPGGFLQPPTWMVDQRTTEFMALIGPRNRRVLVTTKIPENQELKNVTNNWVVWLDPESGRELAKSDLLDAILAGTMVQPGYAGRMYYMGKSGEIKKLTVRPAH
jgi:hypothetical protein